MPTYRIEDFLRTADIYVAPEIQTREHYPFTMANAKRFFDQFRGIPFELDRVARSIFIFRAKEALPRNSFAEGALFSQNCDELEAYAQKNNGNLPNPVGTIFFEYGGTRLEPLIKVKGDSGFVWTTTDNMAPSASKPESEETLEFNGLYFKDDLNTHGYNRYLRFYEDGEVIHTLSNGFPNEVIRWFDRSNPSIEKGHYELQGQKVQFVLSFSGGASAYSGEISGRYLYVVDKIGLYYEYEFYSQEATKQMDDVVSRCKQILNIEGDITELSLKEAYRKAIAKYHPDKVQHLGEEFKRLAEQRATEINDAYEFLRKRYSLGNS